MYTLHNSQQLNDPKEVAEAFVSYIYSTLITDIDTNFTIPPRLTDHKFSSILITLEKIEKALAVVEPS